MNIKTECGSYLAPEHCNREQATAIRDIMSKWGSFGLTDLYQKRVLEIIHFNNAFMTPKSEKVKWPTKPQNPSSEPTQLIIL